jgi:hypothetical protein
VLASALDDRQTPSSGFGPAPPAWPKCKLWIFAIDFAAVMAIIVIIVVALGVQHTRSAEGESGTGVRARVHRAA